jgi:hypothetical protein
VKTTFGMTQKLPPGDPEILHKPVDQLPIIEELSAFMYRMEFKNLKEMLEFSAPDLLKTQGFGYRCLASLLNLLDEHGCIDLLRERDDL